MISYDLSCAVGHQFEGWFGSSTDFDNQQLTGLIACPVCNDLRIVKIPMAPSIGRKGNQVSEGTNRPLPEPSTDLATLSNMPSIPVPMIKVIEQLASMQTAFLKNSQWVGNTFAEEARAIHYGESATRNIHGEASSSEAEALVEEGIEIGLLPLPLIPANVKN
jgi:hypothetical protein